MSDQWEKIILKAKPAPAPQSLLSAVMNRIAEEKAMAPARRKFFIFSGLSFVSAAALIMALIMAKGEFAQSDFPTFLSLLWSDFSVVAASWRSYLSSLAETLPTMSVILVLTAIFALANFLREAAKNVSAIHPHIRHKIA